MLRGGSWNNNEDNARAVHRNNNHPANRNNNIGFRVVVAFVHPLLSLLWSWRDRMTARCAPIRSRVPAMAADYGLQPEAKEERSAEPVWSARNRGGTWGTARVRRIHKTGRDLDSFPSRPLLRRLDPAAEQPANLSDHPADVFVLPAGQPVPLRGQAQIQPELVQVSIGSVQMPQPFRPAPRVGVVDRLLEVERRVEKSSCNYKALRARELLSAWDQP